MQKENVVICPPCGENIGLPTKEGQNWKKALWPLLPRLTAVLPPQGREMNRAFTLIELLVVVLIIGILAAVAVPQYQKAVFKSRVTEAKVLLKTMVDAGDLWLLKTGENILPPMDKLDVEIPAETANWAFEFNESDGNGISASASYLPNNFGNFVIGYTSAKMTTDDFAGKWWCSSNDEQGNKTCQNVLGGTLIDGYDDIYELP